MLVLAIPNLQVAGSNPALYS